MECVLNYISQTQHVQNSSPDLLKGAAVLEDLRSFTAEMHACLDKQLTVTKLMQGSREYSDFAAYLHAMLDMQRELEGWKVDERVPFMSLLKYTVEALREDIPVSLAGATYSTENLNYFETLGAFYVLSGSLMGVSYLKTLLRSEVKAAHWPRRFLDVATGARALGALKNFRDELTQMNVSSEELGFMREGARKVFSVALHAFSPTNVQ